MTPAIEVQGLTKQYGGATVVRDVSFMVEHSEIFGLIGPNGAGKSATVECIEGLRKPDAGHISVRGLNPGRDRGELRERVGIQLQDAELPPRLRVGEALRLYSSFYAAPADWRALMETLGLTGQRKTQFGELSGGQRQRLSIALALVGRPEVVVLDELTTGLDPQARRDTWALIEGVRDRGATIVLVTHFMEEAERLCDRIAVIVSGRIVALDTPAALASGADVGQRIMFRPDRPLDEAELLALPEVRSVQRRAGQVTVTGTDAMLNAVTTLLARRGIVPRQLRVDQASLEDAFMALTGRPHDENTTLSREKIDVR
jgi:ABC-2 type transport system ATP-binding protein